MKHLNSKGMTLVEVIISVAILSLASVAVFQSTMFLIKMYGNGKIIYETNIQISKKIERSEGDISNGTVKFKAGSNSVTVNGEYHLTVGELGSDISLIQFKPY